MFDFNFYYIHRHTHLYTPLSIMSGVVRASLRKLVPAVRCGVQRRTTCINIGPPKEIIPVAERVALHTVIAVAMLVPMFTVMYNMDEYTGKATRVGGRKVWTDPTFVGSDGQLYYVPEED